MKKKPNYLFFIAMYLLSFIFFNILVSSILFLLKQSITSINVIIAMILSILLMMYTLKKDDNYKLKSFAITIAVPISIIIGTTFISGKVYDYSWDGNSYHKSTIGILSDGWNPVYETMKEFDEKRGIKDNSSDSFSLWGEHYAKASHIYAANIMALTHNVESGKSINTISIIALALFILSLLLKKNNKLLFSIIFTIVIITSATISSQYLTNYVDILVYIYMFLLMYVFISFELDKKNQNNLILVYIMTLCIIINIKFSSFGYAGIYCLGFYLWYISRLKKEKIKDFFVKFTIASVCAVLLGVLVIGASSYVKNYIDHGHPFYPIMGDGKVDIMTLNQPKSFKNKSPIEKFTIATFSKADNISYYDDAEPQYKIPFTISNSEIGLLSSCDLRISGNGLIFSGILIITTIIIILKLPKLYNKDKTLFTSLLIPLVITVILIVAMQDVWWARYFPQLHFINFIAIILLNLSKNKKDKVIKILVLCLLLINNLSILRASTLKSYTYTKDANIEFDNVKNEISSNCKLNVETKLFYGTFYNIRESLKDYNPTFKVVDELKTNDTMPLMKGYSICYCNDN